MRDIFHGVTSLRQPFEITLLLCGVVSWLPKIWLERVYGGELEMEAIFVFGEING